MATKIDRRPDIQHFVVVVAALGLIALCGAASLTGGAGQGVVVVIGAVAGMSLYHSSFGFTSAWRRLLLERRTEGLRAQIVMLAVAMLFFFPLLELGSAFGRPLTGFVNPVGPALGLGAFVFGVGMQLGGGCGSGTLYAAGGGNARMAVVLGAFIAGSLIATADPLGWQSWGDLGAYSIVAELGALPGLGVCLGGLAMTYALLLRLDLISNGNVRSLWPEQGGFIQGPWPLILGAVALAFVNVATLLASGRPWGITAAFALWGGKVAILVGIDVGAWRYWQGDPGLRRSILTDTTSLMDLGVMVGALAAAGLAGRFRPQARIPLSSLAAAVLGGLMMGIGARMATGCNIGAFFSGVASGSLHGVVWLVFAIPGNAMGVRLRPIFRLPL